MRLARSTLSLQVNTGACARQTGQRSAAVATQHGVKVFAVDDEERRAFAAPRRSIHSSQFSVVFSHLLSFSRGKPSETLCEGRNGVPTIQIHETSHGTLDYRINRREV